MQNELVFAKLFKFVKDRDIATTSSAASLLDQLVCTADPCNSYAIQSLLQDWQSMKDLLSFLLLDRIELIKSAVALMSQASAFSHQFYEMPTLDGELMTQRQSEVETLSENLSIGDLTEREFSLDSPLEYSAQLNTERATYSKPRRRIHKKSSVGYSRGSWVIEEGTAHAQIIPHLVVRSFKLTRVL